MNPLTIISGLVVLPDCISKWRLSRAVGEIVGYFSFFCVFLVPTSVFWAGDGVLKNIVSNM